MSWIRVVAITCMMLLVLLFLLEIIGRLAWTVMTCYQSGCDFTYITKVMFRSKEAYSIGISRYDNELGYLPKEGFDKIINMNKPIKWINARVTISDDGFRVNDSDIQKMKSNVLVVGDSFTFGDQVSNHETWPACLEKKIHRGVDNAGVFGYGGAQALKRASTLTDKKDYSTVVLSILVGDGFNRDRLSYRYGFPKPALINTERGIEWSEVSNPNVPGTKYYEPNWPNLQSFLHDRVFILAILASYYPRLYDTFTEVHPNAADIEQIIAWTLEEFTRMKVPKKILLLQYAANLRDIKIQTERNIIINAARRHSIQVVDTFDALTTYDHKELWDGHHTPLGNYVVCNHLYERAFQ